MAPPSRIVSSPDGARLFVAEWGDRTSPTVVLVHGYPDTHGCWLELAGLLAARLHVVAYDIRGMGRSTAPSGRRAFALPRLAGDLSAVVEAVSPTRPVHLVGHDWGAVLCWEAVAGGALAGRVASFTSIAAPRIDAIGAWVRTRLVLDRRALGELLHQARMSWYIAAFQIPRLPDAVLAGRAQELVPQLMRRVERIEPRPGHPADTLALDAVRGLALYRDNVLPMRVAHPPAEIPVALVIPTYDRYLSPALYDEADGWAREIRRHEVPAGHWVQRSHPEVVAEIVDGLVAGLPSA